MSGAHRVVMAVLVAASLALLPPAALAQDGAGLVPYSFEPTFLALYDGETEYAFLPSKGVQHYEGREMLPGGYVQAGDTTGPTTTYFIPRGEVSAADPTKYLFALMEIKITNYDQNRQYRVFKASDFYLENPRGAIYYPHPYTAATTQRLAKPGQATTISLGFEVPQGSYTLLYRDVDLTGKTLLVEVWRYDVSLSRGPLTIIGRFTSGLVVRLMSTVFGLIDGLVGGQ